MDDSSLRPGDVNLVRIRLAQSNDLGDSTLPSVCAVLRIWIDDIVPGVGHVHGYDLSARTIGYHRCSALSLEPAHVGVRAMQVLITYNTFSVLDAHAVGLVNRPAR